MLSSIPPVPETIDGGRHSALVPLRFEDVTQDGRAILTGIPHALGSSAWKGWGTTDDSVRCHTLAMVPILGRLILEAYPGPISVFDPMQTVGTWHRAAVRNARGEVEKIVLVMWCDLSAPKGNTYLPTAADAPTVSVGRVYAEHVYTRLFAAANERRVLDVPGAMPQGAWNWRTYTDVGAPAGEILSSHPITFGIGHTDSNQHVNSLVYPRLFEDAVLKTLPGWGLARRCEAMFRKPFFAGDVCEIRIWRTDDGVGGAFVDAQGGERCRIALSDRQSPF